MPRIKTRGFICGCGHSGNTLMATILARHSSVYLRFVETNIFFKWAPLALYRYAAMQRAAVRAGKTTILDKTPRHVRRIGKIRRLVPGARFVIPVRDGRDVVASIAERLGETKTGLDRWISDNTLVLAERGREDVLIYRYEDLVGDPVGTVQKVCAFLDLDFSETLLDPKNTRGRWTRPDDGAEPSAHVRRRNAQVGQAIFDGSGRWRSELGEAEIGILTEGPGKPLMEAFGYLPATDYRQALR